MIIIGIILHQKNKNSPSLSQKHQHKIIKESFNNLENDKTIGYSIKEETKEEMEARIRAKILKEIEEKNLQKKNK